MFALLQKGTYSADKEATWSLQIAFKMVTPVLPVGEMDPATRSEAEGEETGKERPSSPLFQRSYLVQHVVHGEWGVGPSLSPGICTLCLWKGFISPRRAQFSG
jgi:hypothetical protein